MQPGHRHSSPLAGPKLRPELWVCPASTRWPQRPCRHHFRNGSSKHGEQKSSVSKTVCVSAVMHTSAIPSQERAPSVSLGRLQPGDTQSTRAARPPRPLRRVPARCAPRTAHGQTAQLSSPQPSRHPCSWRKVLLPKPKR